MNKPIGGGKTAHQRQRPPAAAVNPYNNMKKKNVIPPTKNDKSAATNKTPKVVRNSSADPVTTTKKTSVARSTNPYQRGIPHHTNNKMVTPTPKKPRHSSHAPSIHKHPASVIATKTPSQHQHRNVPHNKVPVPPTRRQPALKTSLKSQIAELQRKKKLFLQQKEAERQRLIREKEMKHQAMLQEKERRKKERRLRKQMIEKCVEDLITGVQQRINLEEKNGGVHYNVCEAVEGIISTIESKKKQEAEHEKKKQEEEQRKVAILKQQQMQSRNYPVSYQQQTAMTAAAYGMQQCPPSMQHLFGHHHPSMMQQPVPHIPTQHATIVSSNTNIPYPASYNTLSRPVPVQAVATVQLPTKTNQIEVKQLPTKDSLPLHSSPVLEPHSPYYKTHYIYPADICMMKKNAGESFGVTLRFESKCALVPQGTVVGNNDTTTANKPLRRLVHFGVMVVVDATRATFASDSTTVLKPGDMILGINGKSVGALSFSQACRAIGVTSAVCSTTGAVRCVLRVARMRAPQTFVNSLPQASMQLGAPAIQMIPFNAVGNTVISGEFSLSEWSSLVRGLLTIPHQLYSGMALLPVAKKEVIETLQKTEEYSKHLRQRSKETLDMKCEHAGKRVALELNVKGAQHCAVTWTAEVEKDKLNENNDLFDGPLTDTQRSILRAKARPAKGCKCGSESHQRVNDPKCPLYRDVRQFCTENSINITISERKNEDTIKALTKRKKGAKSTMEKAYIDRFIKHKSENAMDRREADFEFEVEKIQCSKMKKAIFVPSTLCTLVLSAVASVMDQVIEDGPEVLNDSHSGGEDSKNDPVPMQGQPTESDSDSDDSDDDDDMPLHLLLQNSTAKRAAATKSNSPPSKRPKQSETKQSNEKKEKTVPHPYFLAQILKIVSQTHGHLFRGKPVMFDIVFNNAADY